MDPIELSNYAGLGALGLLTLDILLGLLLATKYNPVRRWPHRRIDTVRIHNLVGYAALVVTLVHPGLLLLPSRVPFGLLDLLLPLDAPKQPLVNTAGAAATYLLIVVVTTSIWRFELGRRRWKAIHFATYALFPLVAIHALLTDPSLRDRPIDYLDGEKVFVELCIALPLAAMALRVRWGRAHPPRRRSRSRPASAESSPAAGGSRQRTKT